MEERKEIFFKKRLIGLDSGILIDLIDNPDMFYYQSLRIFKRDKIIYTSVRCIDDAMRVLINRKNYSFQQASQKINQFLYEHKINKIQRICELQDIEKIKKVAKEKNININEEDLPIIADFKKFGINKVFTKDKNFAELCKIVGIEAESMPVIEREISRQFYQLFKTKYKKSKKKH
jgi:predicted nucleic acid-binding protein